MSPGDFFAELKRRNVYKVAVAYAVAGWALSQGSRAGRCLRESPRFFQFLMFRTGSSDQLSC